MSTEKISTVGIYIISMDKDKKLLRLGRGNDVDIRISDISISRCHAIIKQKEDGF